MLTVLEE
jgi:aspartate-semialdehyde dehydrogenase